MSPRRRQEPKMVKISRFLTPPSAPRHDSTRLFGVPLTTRGPQKAKKCRTVVLFREKTFKSLGLAAFMRLFSQPNRVFLMICELEARQYSTFGLPGGGPAAEGRRQWEGFWGV